MNYHGRNTQPTPLDPLQPEDDGLWDLLGQAKPVEPSPFFARDVLRQVRLARDQSPVQLLSPLLRRWRLALIGAVALAVVTLNGMALLHESQSPPLLTVHSAENDQLANLDEFLAYEPTSGWN
jgi:hypothetical protein